MQTDNVFWLGFSMCSIFVAVMELVIHFGGDDRDDY